MKKIFFFLFAAIIGIKAAGQSQAETFIKEAQDLIEKKEYKQAQLSLQDAMNEINMMLALQVAESLPAEINGLKAEGDGEIGGSGMGMMGGGMQIIKRYRNDAKPENDAEVQIIVNSPMISAMNMYLTNPSMAGAGYKSVRVGTTRAILKTDLQDSENGVKTRLSEIQIPIGQTLMNIHANGFTTEQDELSFANKLDLEKIRTALGE